MQSISDVDKANLCIGCGICSSIASKDSIEIQIGKDGFYHPIILDKAQQNWSQIKEVCPGIRLKQPIQAKTSEEKMWGPVEKIWTGHATDDEIRWQASSGGGITGLLQYALEMNIVDGVIHTGASLSDPLMNATFISRNRTDVLRQSGSRYAPASPLKSIREILDSTGNEKFIFVGKPCDVAALRAYLEIFSQYRERFISLITFMCAGTPSLRGTESVVNALGVKKEEVDKFWYRGHGWPGKATAVDFSGKQYSMSYNDSWGTILNKHLHFRCKICPDGIGSIADITFGDAWEEKDGYPSFEEGPGKSLIIARSIHGRNLVEDAVAHGYLSVQSYSINILDKIQPYQRDRKRLAGSRLLALKLSGLASPRFHGFNLLHNAMLIGLKPNLESFLGTFERSGSLKKNSHIVYIFAYVINKVMDRLILLKRYTYELLRK